jgi:hypothetical protein
VTLSGRACGWRGYPRDALGATTASWARDGWRANDGDEEEIGIEAPVKHARRRPLRSRSDLAALDEVDATEVLRRHRRFGSIVASRCCSATIASVGRPAETPTPTAAKAIISHDSDPDRAGRALVANPVAQHEVSERRSNGPGFIRNALLAGSRAASAPGKTASPPMQARGASRIRPCVDGEFSIASAADSYSAPARGRRPV